MDDDYALDNILYKYDFDKLEILKQENIDKTSNELDYNFEGVLKIITSWFTYYQGKGKTKIINFDEVE